jgi:hypothetical protein
VLAGRQVLLEPFIFNILLDTGHWRADPVVDRICAGDVGLLVLAYPLEVGAGMTDGLHALWTPAVMAALADTLELEGVQAQRYVYSRSPSPARCRSAQGAAELVQVHPIVSGLQFDVQAR